MGGYSHYLKQKASIKRKPLEQNQDIWRPWEGGPQRMSTAKFHCRLGNCDVTFRRESELRRHEQSVHHRNVEICQVCSKEFTRKDNLTRHMKTRHRDLPSKPRCLFCKKILSRQDAVQRHMGTCPNNPDKKYSKDPSNNRRLG